MASDKRSEGFVAGSNAALGKPVRALLWREPSSFCFLRFSCVTWRSSMGIFQYQSRRRQWVWLQL